jgi:hypothetical protein
MATAGLQAAHAQQQIRPTQPPTLDSLDIPFVITAEAIKSSFMEEILYGAKMVDYEFYENGTGVAKFESVTPLNLQTNPEFITEIHFNHTYTAENGYRYEDGKLYAPGSSEPLMIFQEEW